MWVFLQAIALFLVGTIILKGLNALGVPYCLITIGLLTFLLFFRTIMSRVQAGLYAMGGTWPSQIADWLGEVELVQEGPVEKAREKQCRVAAKEEQARQQARFDAIAERVFEEHAEPAVFIVPETSKLARSRSRIGGAPHLPQDVEWPRFRGTGSPLHFLAAVHLDELPQDETLNDLPRQGVLYFFLDLTHGMLDGVVLHFAQEGDAPTPTPEDLEDLGTYQFKAGAHPALLRRCGFRMVPGPVAVVPYDLLRLDTPTAQGQRDLFNEFHAAEQKAYEAAVQAHPAAAEMTPALTIFTT